MAIFPPEIRSASKTVAASVDRLYGAWIDPAMRARWLEAPIEIRRSIVLFLVTLTFALLSKDLGWVTQPLREREHLVRPIRRRRRNETVRALDVAQRSRDLEPPER